jgi:heat shock protein HslJ
VKLALLVLALLVTLVALPVLAQDTLTFNDFSFTLDPAVAANVNITRFAGDPPDLQAPGGPEVAHTQFILYNAFPVPESIFDSQGGIRVYNIADFGPYDFPSQRLAQLQTLLAERPDLAQFTVTTEDDSDELPLMPVMPAGQVIRARPQFVETATVQGISYVTVYRQDASPFLGSEFIYTFQGISTDGAHYVSAIFPLETALFPAETPADFDYDAFIETINDYFAQSVTTLNDASPDAFTPSLTALDAMVQTFTFSAPGGDVVPTTVPAPEVTATPGDTSFGGLGNVTWTLLSYGPADAPIAVLPNAPITLTFGPEGIGGSAGCNSYFGTFQFDVSVLTFSNIGRTEIACDQPIMDQENVYLEALNTASTYQLGNGQLQITYAAGGVLTFSSTAFGGLGGVTWNLVSSGPADAPVAVLPTAPITLIFGPEGIGGSAGCNSYFGAFQSNIGVLTISDVGSTLIACDQPIMDQEFAYLEALRTATAYQITADGQLQITYAGGVLTFAPATV